MNIRWSWQRFLRLLASGCAFALATFICYRLQFNTATVVLLYLLIIVWQSWGGEFLLSAAVCLSAAACLDFFFLPPILSLRIADPLNILAFAVFLLVALVITHLVSRVRAEAQSAERRGANLERLYNVTRRLLLEKPDRISPALLVRTFGEAFGPCSVCFFDAETAELYSHGTPHCDLADRIRKAYVCNIDSDDRTAEVVVRCLRSGSAVRGAIGFEGLPDSDAIVGPLLVLACAAMEQARVFRKSSDETAAAQAEAFRSAILDALAHEFKTPLATILAVVGGLRESSRLEADEREMARIIESETSRLSSLTTRLLRLARLDREELSPRVRSINIQTLVERVVKRSANQFPERQIAVNCQCACTDVPADRELLDLALTQLLDNALKYSIPDTPVMIEITTEEGLLAIRVRNEGSSIAPADRERIFERFYRGADVRKLISGAGLGLYVARKIVVAHGGTLVADKNTDAGSVVFSLKLPVPSEVSQHAAIHS